MTIEITGLDEALNLLEKLDSLCQSNELKEYIAERAIDEINKIAKSRLSTNDNYISNNKYKITKDGILIYNDVQAVDGSYYSLIIEYGSGTKAEGSYNTGKVYWYVPEEKGPNLKNYNYKSYTTEDGETIYMVFGQKPKHIYNDASKIIENNITKWALDFIRKEIK